MKLLRGGLLTLAAAFDEMADSPGLRPKATPAYYLGRPAAAR